MATTKGSTSFVQSLTAPVGSTWQSDDAAQIAWKALSLHDASRVAMDELVHGLIGQSAAGLQRQRQPAPSGSGPSTPART